MAALARLGGEIRLDEEVQRRLGNEGPLGRGARLNFRPRDPGYLKAAHLHLVVEHNQACAQTTSAENRQHQISQAE